LNGNAKAECDSGVIAAGDDFWGQGWGGTAGSKETPQECGAGTRALPARAIRWRYRVGLSGERDRDIRKVWLFQTYTGVLYRDLLSLDDPQVIRRGEKGAIHGSRGWQSLLSHKIGKWSGTLFVYPMSVLADCARSDQLDWVEPDPAGSDGHPEEATPGGAGGDARPPVLLTLRCRLDPRTARAHYERLIRSGAVTANSEAISPFLARVDNTRLTGHAEIEFAGLRKKNLWRPTRLLVSIRAGLTADEKPDDPLGQEPHVLITAEHTLSNWGGVSTPAIPKDALRYFK